ncbi:spondin-1-like isoform X2 [Zootermopsis nevadensis]|uniref:spondin-1-like isoform X2 n=1 Tax=Zootermopsis nevadensis TaxID=136037 RepID=UPI000B8E609E|nr:spondin-1-like isoform X2 [Zootermopsis nevadensis]
MQSLIQLIVCILVAKELNRAEAIYCNRDPEDIHTPKSKNSPFRIRISGNPDKYVPEGVYTVSLRGQRSGRYQATFERFMLVVEPKDHSSSENNDTGDKNVGSFALVGNTIAKYSNQCPNAIIQMSSLKKAEVKVTWTAPPPGSGCVVFRATIVEDHEVWYKDGELSHEFCEDDQENEFYQPEFDFTCYACDDALYEMTFEGLWSKYTHPKEFPENGWLTGFTDLIGASHSPHYYFWEYGRFASEGLRLVAELGSTHELEKEIIAKSKNIRTIIKARGLAYPNVTGKTSTFFRVDRKHYLFSVVSRIAPSPDWIIGVSGINLCLKNGSWVDYREFDLYPLDAGTDNGITYMSPDEPTSPHKVVIRITSSYPNDPRSPFYDPSGSKVLPLARLYLRRWQLFERECCNESEENCNVDQQLKMGNLKKKKEKRKQIWLPDDEEIDGVASTSEPEVTDDTTKEDSTVVSPLNELSSSYFLDFNMTYGLMVSTLPTYNFESEVEPRNVVEGRVIDCVVSRWTRWSKCSVSCGCGYKTRNRSILVHSRNGGKACPKLLRTKKCLKKCEW